ncbi:MAG: sigma-70 family RNA polymerase sigma factor [Deltaproteobacteria bacterium]|jgi:RNA polymerase sigma-70 factor (ECF subfamily)
MDEARQQDLALVRAVVEGEAGAFGRLRAQLEQPIARSLDRLLVQWREAVVHREDLLQGLELHLVRDDFAVLRTFRGDAQLKTWIRAVATRHFYAEVKRIAAHDKEERGEVPDEQPHPGASPEDAAVREDLRRRVRTVIETLDDRDRALVGLVFEQGSNATAAAQVLGLKPSAVRMRKKRLLERLQKALKGVWP